MLRAATEQLLYSCPLQLSVLYLAGGRVRKMPPHMQEKPRHYQTSRLFGPPAKGKFGVGDATKFCLGPTLAVSLVDPTEPDPVT